MIIVEIEVRSISAFSPELAARVLAHMANECCGKHTVVIDGQLEPIKLLPVRIHCNGQELHIRDVDQLAASAL